MRSQGRYQNSRVLPELLSVSEDDSSRTKLFVRDNTGQRFVSHLAYLFRRSAAWSGIWKQISLACGERHVMLVLCFRTRYSDVQGSWSHRVSRIADMLAIWKPGTHCHWRGQQLGQRSSTIFASFAGIHLKIAPSYQPRGNAKIEEMVGTLKRTVQKITERKIYGDWHMCFDKILGVIGDDPALIRKSLSKSCLRSSLCSHLRSPVSLFRILS